MYMIVYTFTPTASSSGITSHGPRSAKTKAISRKARPTHIINISPTQSSGGRRCAYLIPRRGSNGPLTISTTTIVILVKRFQGKAPSQSATHMASRRVRKKHKTETKTVKGASCDWTQTKLDTNNHRIRENMILCAPAAILAGKQKMMNPWPSRSPKS